MLEHDLPWVAPAGRGSMFLRQLVDALPGTQVASFVERAMHVGFRTSSVDEIDGAYWLAVGLEQLPPLEATAVACEWALSDRADQRLALARALGWAFPLLGDGSVLAHLARDPDPHVQLAAEAAMHVRRYARA